MLEYAKTIMQKVSFNKALMQKELKKALMWLNEQERADLAQWIRANFGNVFEDLFRKEKEEVIF